MSNCTFEEFEPAINGRRRVRCVRCGLVTAPTGSALDNIYANCTVADEPDPGEELAKLIRQLGIHVDCSACKELAAKMREWGVDGCREHRAEIIAEITSRVGSVNWRVVVAAAVRSALTFPVDLLDPVGSLLDEAIRRASVSCRQAASRQTDEP